MNERLFSRSDEALNATLTDCAGVVRGLRMKPRITVNLSINVAACLFGIAAIIKALS
jgi:hypothetical protein